MRRLLGLLLLPLAAVASAQETTGAEPPPRGLDASIVGDAAGRTADGILSANVAAGSGNVQANLRAIAAGASSDASAAARQRIDATGADRGRDASAVLTGAAFGAARGVVGLNQAAGSANAQANVLAVGTQPVAGLAQQIDNLVLASVHADAGQADATTAPAAAPLREARIDGAAVRSPAGVFQLNQTAGVGNASANVLVLRLPGSTP